MDRIAIPSPHGTGQGVGRNATWGHSRRVACPRRWSQKNNHFARHGSISKAGSDRKKP